jgi:RNA polymerase sigma factor (sigma-70 family)
VNELSDQQLLREYADGRRETAFAELVRRYVDLVHSAALRMVRDTGTAQDVTQGVFLALAGNARRLAAHPVLSGWLHCTARNLAAKAIRSEARRRVREQEAAAMNELLSAESEPSWKAIAPQLDVALGELNAADRDALLLRYFEKKSAPEMARILGISDEAAQKRVTRAMDRLREFFSSRNVKVGTAGLVGLISANAVQSAPAGLAATISAAALAGTAISTSTLIAATKTMVMTTLQKTLITLAIAGLAGAGIYEARTAVQLRAELQDLQQAQAPLLAQIQQLQKERDGATNRLAAATRQVAAAKPNPAEVLKLRGEVGKLHQEQQLAGEKSAINKLTADPASRAMLRDQQKMGMTALYKSLAKQLGLTPDQTDKLNDVLADGVMNDVNLITQALHDGRSQLEINQIFAAADQQVQAQIQSLLGDDALAKYNEYNQNLLSSLTVEQFADKLTGDSATIQNKINLLQQAMQEQTAAALKTAGLPANYQVVPMLNFANIASAGQGDQSLNLLDGIYANVGAQSSSFLTPDEIASFQNYRTNAIVSSRTSLAINRTMMAPLAR